MFTTPNFITLKRWQIYAIGLIVYDIIAIYLSYWAALYIGYGCEAAEIPVEKIAQFWNITPFYLLFCILFFWVFHLYKGVWRYVSINELRTYVFANLITVLVYIAANTVFALNFPKRYFVIGGALQLIAVVISRFAYRVLFANIVDAIRLRNSMKNLRRGMLIGAGSAGHIILRDIKNSSPDMRICCIIDDSSNNFSRYIEGVPIVGGRDKIISSVAKYRIQEIIFAIPSISAREKSEILDICKETGCKLRILPSIVQLINGEVSMAKMRDVAVEDLLGRDPITVNNSEIWHHISGKVILVTGGGGSIGSELCRQIAAHNPKRLIIFEIYENNAYDIQQELKHKYPNLNLSVLIGSVRDTSRIRWVFQTYKPAIVFHAAAHKHVPLMEDSPHEAIKNNVMGTYKTALAAMLNGAERFVLISTDKAVNPTNIMGASKRLCEMVIQIMDKVSKSGDLSKLPLYLTHHNQFLDDQEEDVLEKNRIKTEFVAVRFGNVLGSNGSVIPLFRKQIAAGGPVTVTHPDIIRYFMTIPEAVSLVLQAETYAKGGEIFVLDMGEPVKIDTLARNLIKLSGFKPDIDIKVEYTGLRPGEKLFEEKLMAEEGLLKTPNDLIHIAQPLNFEIDQFLADIDTLANTIYNNKSNIFEVVAAMVPTFKHKVN